MNTILLATDQPAIRENFESFSSWEALGYAAPLLAASAQEALEILSKTTVHAVAIDLPRNQSAALYDRLHGMHMLYLEPVSDPEALRDVLERMACMIEHQAQRKEQSPALRAPLREAFWQTLMDGLLHSEPVLRNRLTVLDLPFTADDPCLMITLRMLNSETYLSEVWRYGRARLAMALRKFLQAEDGDIHYALSGLRAGRMRLLACATTPMPPEALRKRADAHVAKALADIAEYLELEIAQDESVFLDGLKSLLKQGG